MLPGDAETYTVGVDSLHFHPVALLPPLLDPSPTRSPPSTPAIGQATDTMLPKSVFSRTFQLVARTDALFALGLLRELIWDPLSSQVKWRRAQQS